LDRILVTGAAGFIGSHLTDRLVKLGYEVVGIDCFTGNYPRERKLQNLAWARSTGGFRLVEGDLLDLDLRGLLGGVDGVAHLAGEPGVRASWGPNFALYLERNVRATERLLETAWREGVGAFVYASSSSVYGPDGGGPVKEDSPRRPASPYGLSKLAAEELIGLYARERGVPSTVLRYFTVYGPRQRPEMALARFISATLQGRSVEIFGDGEQVREMTYVSDVVDATVAALHQMPGTTIPVCNVGGGTRTTVNEMLEAVRWATGMPVEALYSPPAEGDVRSTWADSGRAARELGYRPRVGLEEGIRAQVEWTLKRSLAPSLA
jgi:UDP-glucuronate 4-epimerase